MADELVMNVKSNIKSVTKDTDELGESIVKATDETKNLDKGLEETGKSGSKGFKAIGTAVKGFGLALKAAGIGLIISLFVTLKEALERNQKVMNAVNTIMSTVSTTFNQVANVLTDVYEWVTKSSDRFDGLKKVMSGLMTIALVPIKLLFFEMKLAIQAVQLAWEKWLGGADPQKIAELKGEMLETVESIKEMGLAAIEAAKDIGENVGDAIGEIGAIGKVAIDGISEISIKSNIELAKATTAAANSSKLAEVAIQGLIEKYDRQAELQRQIRDDETKTFAERIEANKKLGEILDAQEQEMLALADTRVASAALELSANKENIELQVAYQQALNDRAGVEAQVAGFRSEQMTNEVSLNKELKETQKEVLNATLDGIALELQELENSYQMQLEMARKAGEDTLAITEKYLQDKKAIETADSELLRSLEEENMLALIENLQERALKELEIQEKKELASVELMENAEEIKDQIRIKYARARGEIVKKSAKDEIKWEDMTQEEKLNKVKSTAGEMSKILGEESAAGKAFAITQATIDTYQGATAAYSSMAKIPYVGPVLGGIAAAAAVASGLANVKAIASAGDGGGGGGAGISAGSGGSGGAPPQTPAPQMMSGDFNLTGAVEPEPVKAYVVTDEMSNSQDQLANIRRRATI